VLVTIVSIAEVFYTLYVMDDIIDERASGGFELRDADGQHMSAESIYLHSPIRLLFIGFFAGDAMVKLIAFKGLRWYWASWLNRLDVSVTILQAVSRAWGNPDMGGLRVFRWIAMMTLCRKLTNFYRWP
jgi:hypothetical protein